MQTEYTGLDHQLDVEKQGKKNGEFWVSYTDDRITETH